MHLNTIDFIRHRWSAFLFVQKDVDAVGGRPLDDPLVQKKLPQIEYDFLRTFPCPETAAAFWTEVSAYPDAGTMLGSVAMIAADTLTSGTPLPDVLSGRRFPPVIQHLRTLAAESWSAPERTGLAYVVQQEAYGETGPREARQRAWTSVPRWASDIEEVTQCVYAGWLAGQARWAVSIGSNGEDPQFLTGLDHEGERMKAADVASLIRSTVKSFELPSPARWQVIQHARSDERTGFDDRGVYSLQRMRA